jgi:hypothetical protein
MKEKTWPFSRLETVHWRYSAQLFNHLERRTLRGLAPEPTLPAGLSGITGAVPVSIFVQAHGLQKRASKKPSNEALNSELS